MKIKSKTLAEILSSVQFSRSVLSDSLWPHESHHARPPCPSPTPRVHSNSRPSSWWCHPAISSSVVPFSPCPQSLQASESFPMSQLIPWGGQCTGVSVSFQRTPRADLLQNGLVGSPCSPRDSQESSPTPQFKSINSSAQNHHTKWNKLYTIDCYMIPFIRVSAKGKNIMSQNMLVVFRCQNWQQWFWVQKSMTELLSNGNILFRDCCDGFMIICTCLKSLKCTF